MLKTTNTTANSLLLLLVLAVALALSVGWCVNIYKLLHSDLTTVEPVEVVRCIGVAVPPVGAIAGWL